jgi:hypothetical protein
MQRDKAFRIKHRERVIKNRKKLLKDIKSYLKDEPDGKYAKKHPLDCGNPKCLVCHSSKILGYKKLDEKIIEDSEKEQKEESSD